MNSLSIVVLTKNEERVLPGCLESVQGLGTFIVVDDNSSDLTVSIAKSYGATVFSRTLDTFSAQRNYALSQVTTEWVLFLDADERVTPELRTEIEQALSNATYNGYEIPRKNIIFGKWIEHTDWYPDYQLHLFRKDKGSYYRDVHEQVKVSGTIGRLKNPLIHENYQTIDQFLAKNVFRYADMEAGVLTSGGYVFVWPDLILKPSGEFLRRFFLCRGYMDGVHGLVLSLLMAFHTFTVYTKVWERQGFENKESGNQFLEQFVELVSKASRDYRHWIYTALTESSKSRIKKTTLKIKKRLPFL